MTNISPLPLKMRFSKTVLIAVMCINLLIVFKMYYLENYTYFVKSEVNVHNVSVTNFYRSHKVWKLSKLGNVLYKNKEYPKIPEEKRNRTFLILIWKHWNWLKSRHLYNYGVDMQDPLRECSVKNCVFTGDDDKFQAADAVIIHLHRGDIPSVENRNPNQRWIFLNDESPKHAFFLSNHSVPLKSLHNVFNWSMTYMCNADVPVPYGRTVPLAVPKFMSSNARIADLVPYWEHKRRDVLVSILISNCNILFRTRIIEGLKESIDVDVRGTCGDEHLLKSCPGHFRAECDQLSQYLFYLALENSKCREYMTEKLFYNAYSKGAIPIIQGPSIEDCKLFLPPNSYLHVDNYDSLEELADEIVRISEDDNKLLYYHQWRNHFRVLNEHGFFKTKSFHLCRVCEAMNYNDEENSVYSEHRLQQFLEPSMLCRK